MNTIKYTIKNKMKPMMILLSISIVAIAFIVRELIDTNFDTNTQLEKILIIQEKIHGESHLENLIRFLPYIVYNNLIILIILFEFNKGNSYKTLIIFNVYCLSMFLSGFIQFIVGDANPFMQEVPTGPDDEPEYLYPYNCGYELGFARSSSFIVAATAFYSSIYKINLTGPNQKRGFLWKVICIFPFILVVVLICFLKLIEGNAFLGEIFFSVFFGIAIFIFIFYGFNANYEDRQEFCTIINHKLIIFVIILFGSSLLYIIPFIIKFILRHKLDSKYKHICHDIDDDSKTIFNLNDDYYKAALLSNICLISYLFASFLSFVGCKFELHFIFNENIQNFLTFNFEVGEGLDEFEQLHYRESISITRDTKWNNTDIIKTTIRFFVYLIITIGILAISHIIDFWESFAIMFCIKYLLVHSLLSICLFFLFKVILKSTPLVNRTFLLTIQDNF